MTAAVGLRPHLEFVAGAILDGNVVPVLGAGANLCDRGRDEEWSPGTNLPNGAELAVWLAHRLRCDIDDTGDLLRVSQYADMTRGAGPLYQQLRGLFNNEDYAIPTLHRFLARLPGLMVQNGLPRRHQLIVTTNYDDLLERALQEEGEPFDVIRYLTMGRDRGKFVHEPSEAKAANTKGGGERVIRNPRKYDAVSSEARTVVLKIHGGMDRDDAKQDSYVITEDDYIDYLTHTSPNELIPVKLLAELLNSHFLFLGYAMRDWNLRVLLHRIWRLRDLSWTSWAVQRQVEPFDEKLWSRRGVELHELLLSDYVAQLTACLEDVITELTGRQGQEATGGSDG